MTTAYSGQGIELGHLVANADMDTHQWKFVSAGSVAGEFRVANGASSPTPIGVLMTDPRQGETGTIRIAGTAKVAASGAITYGTFVKAASNGCASAVGAGEIAHGRALGAITSGSGYIEVLLLPSACTAAAT